MMSVELESLGRKSAIIQLEFDADCRSANMESDLPGWTPRQELCLELEPKDIGSANGHLDLCLDKQKAAALFPQLTANCPSHQIAFLLATSRLVGMRCPGLNSIYRALTLFIDSTQHDVDSLLTWATNDFDERYNVATVSLAACGMRGSLQAFVRPRPQEQPSAKDIHSRIAAGLFQQQRALVIGGSRGIGEVCAKILAAGGADVCLTCHSGLDDAARVVEDVASAGGRATAFALDVLASSSDLARKLPLGWFPTNVYFFATPSISGQAVSGRFVHERFLKFCDFYVRGVANVHAELRSISNQPFELFYASSVFVDDVPTNMGEYAAAKAAGEMFCHFLSKTDHNLKVHIERFPRLPTDQTVGIYEIPLGGARVDIVKILCQSLAR
jgi:NADP-dependent 3-hydroxy acid dehydrogenase YdfG